MSDIQNDDAEFNPAGGAILSAGEQPDMTEARRRLVANMQANVKADKARWKKEFDQMKKNMRHVREGTSQEAFRHGKKYVANITNRYINSRVAKLYAKNPKVTYEKRLRRNFRFWDEDPAKLEAIYAKFSSGMPLDQNDIQIIMDFQEGTARMNMYDGIGDTLVKAVNYYLTEQKPKFKTQMKQLIRRTLICKVGYVKAGYQRELQRRADNQAQIDDITLKLQNMQTIAGKMQDGEITQEDPEMETLRLQLEQLQNDPGAMEVIREGLVFDFPRSNQIIPGSDCENLVGFIGASRVTHESYYTADEIKAMYPEANLEAGNFAAYERRSQNVEDGYKAVNGYGVGRDLHRMYGCVWEYYDRNTGMVYTMLEGHHDFLEEPSKPNVEVEGFYPIYALVFNGIEDDETIYPKADAELIMPMQDEWNRAREGLREHRQAGRPRYAMGKGMLENEDKTALQNLGAHQTIELNLGDKKISDVIGAIPTVGVDQNLYTTAHLTEDMNLVLGVQESSMGATSGVTATEVADAAASQMSSIESNIDDLDDFMTEFARDAGQILMLNSSKELIEEIVGPGAIWPEMEATRAQVVKELYVEIEAGSSGKANKAVELNNFERMTPLLTQWPGLNKMRMLKEFIRRLDDRLNPAEFVDDNAMSVVAMNALKIPPSALGNPGAGGEAPPAAGPGAGASGVPEQQGAMGAQNDPGANNFDQPSGSIAPMGVQ